MIKGTESPIVQLTCRVAARLIQVFALYVVFHGHYSPGGGFQGGGLLAAATILLRISEGKSDSQRELPSAHVMVIGSVGALLFAGVGVMNLLSGGQFLQYDSHPVGGISSASSHFWGILVIEIGVAMTVMAILVAIFDSMMEGLDDD